MTYFDDVFDHPKEAASAQFVGSVGRQIQDALVSCRVEGKKLTQQEIARRLGVERSQVNRLLSGHANMTIATLAELLWAMECEPKFSVEQLDPGVNNYAYADGIQQYAGLCTATSDHSKNVFVSNSPSNKGLELIAPDGFKVTHVY